MKVKRKNVVRNKKTGMKEVVFVEKELPDSEWEFVCERPHDDGDFSYICGFDYCRCMS